MKSETRLASYGEITTISFDKLDTALIKEVTTPYFKNYADRYNTAQQASIILLNSMEESELRQEPLSVDLEPFERPVFIGEMAIALTTYMDEQMKFWYTLTSRVPRWLDDKYKNLPVDYHEVDEMHDPAAGIDLDTLERKLGYINMLGLGFKKLGEQISD